MPVRPLSKELQQKAEDELNEVPNRIEEDIKYVRDWLSSKPQLHIATDDQWLLSFLRSCKFNYQKTLEKLELHSLQQEKIPEFFGNRDPLSDEVQEVLKLGIYTILPRTANPASSRILLFRAGCCDPVKTHMRSLMKVILLFMEVLFLEDDNCAVAGLVMVVDLEGFSYKYLTQVTPYFLKKAFFCFLFAYPTRLKRVCFVNCPSFFAIMYRLMKIFAPAKIKERLVIYNNFTDLYEDVPQSLLPQEYGGDEKTSDELAADWKLKVESYKKWFMKTSK